MNIEDFFKKHRGLKSKYGICDNNNCILTVVYEGSGKRKYGTKVKYVKCREHGVIPGEVWTKYIEESNELYYELNGRPTLSSNKNKGYDI